ncbi:hypothetical protein [Oceanobacillus sp. CAU 1775]
MLDIKHLSREIFENCNCSDHQNSNCRCSHALCANRFRIRLSGLKDNLNYRLRKLVGRVVILELENAKDIEARICFVGSDFIEVDIVRLGKVLILPFAEINDIRFKDA